MRRNQRVRRGRGRLSNIMNEQPCRSMGGFGCAAHSPVLPAVDEHDEGEHGEGADGQHGGQMEVCREEGRKERKGGGGSASGV